MPKFAVDVSQLRWETTTVQVEAADMAEAERLVWEADRSGEVDDLDPSWDGGDLVGDPEYSARIPGPNEAARLPVLQFGGPSEEAIEFLTAVV